MYTLYIYKERLYGLRQLLDLLLTQSHSIIYPGHSLIQYSYSVLSFKYPARYKAQLMDIW